MDDKDLKEAFDEVAKANTEIGNKIDGLSETVHDLHVETTRQITDVDGRARSAHHRITEGEERTAKQIDQVETRAIKRTDEAEGRGVKRTEESEERCAKTVGDFLDQYQRDNRAKSGRMWGLWGAVIAAVIAGIFTLIAYVLPEKPASETGPPSSDPVVID